MSAGIILFLLMLLREICRDDGLADRHLRWQRPVRRELRATINWILPITPVLGFVVAATTVSQVEPAEAGLGRPIFLLLMLVLTVLVWRLLGPGSALHAEIADGRKRSLPKDLRFIWLPVLLGLPLALGLLSASGYHYTAIRLTQDVRETVWLVISLIILKDLILRWLNVTERRLRFADAIERRDEARQDRRRRVKSPLTRPSCSPSRSRRWTSWGWAIRPSDCCAPQAKVDAFAHAVQGLARLEDDPEKQSKYSGFQGLLQGREEGRQEGREEGRQEGRQEGGAAILLRLLQLKFGEIAEAIRRRIESADSETLLAWSDRVLSASRLEQVVDEPY